jgi:type VI secretion system secreted protein VgrG
MHKLKVSKIGILAFLLAVVVAGCGDPDKNAGAGNPGDQLTPPTVTFVTPLAGSTVVCPNLGLITATFSKPMNPATITPLTFTLTGPSGNVSGTVAYVAATHIATFTPSGALAASSPFTATITTGAQDQFGNGLAANFVWTFTTSGPCASAGGIALGAACSFGILGATPSVSSVGPTTVSGDIGIFPAASITGFPPGTFTGAEHLGDAVAHSAQDALTTAFNAAMAQGGGPSVGTVLTADIGGQTLAPGIYRTTSAQPTLAITGDLHLSGNGVYIFKVVSALTTAAGGASGPPASQVILSGGAVSHDVFWVIGSAATLGTYSKFEGTIMSMATTTLGTGATLKGRALSRSAAVALDSNPVTVPPCP